MSLAIAAGADVKMLQNTLGHASAVMTLDRYGHLMPGRAQDVADRLDALAWAAVAERSPPRCRWTRGIFAGSMPTGPAPATAETGPELDFLWVVETGVDPVTFRFSGGRSAD